MEGSYESSGANMYADVICSGHVGIIVSPHFIKIFSPKLDNLHILGIKLR